MNAHQLAVFKSIFKSSNHPLSKSIFQQLDIAEYKADLKVEEMAGLGIQATVENNNYKIGSAKYILNGGQPQDESDFRSSRVYLSINDKYLGYYRVKNEFRAGLADLAKALHQQYEIHILSGDNNSEENNLREIFGSAAVMKFHQTPVDKLKYIENLQETNKKVLMMGDGLNDAGALKQADVGIAVTEDTNNFFPACDGMIKAESLNKLSAILKFSKICMNVMKYSFIISLLYNVVGLSFAVRGELLPVIAAIIMPLSSISVISFTVLTSTLMSKRIKL